MGIISLRCRKFCCIGRIGRLLQAVGSWRSLPLPCYSVFYCHYTTCLQAVQPALGPSRVCWEKYRGAPPKNAKRKHDWLWRDSLVQGTYWIRGANRRKAQENGLAVGYDRLAVMAVSVFHLSHWRCDVTIDHYLLAV